MALCRLATSGVVVLLDCVVGIAGSSEVDGGGWISVVAVLEPATKRGCTR